MNAYQRQLPLQELMLVAELELSNNPTITSYTFENGSERRRFANPMQRLQVTLDRMFEQICDLMGIDFKAIAEFVDSIDGRLSEETA